MKVFTSFNLKNVLATLRILTIEKPSKIKQKIMPKICRKLNHKKINGKTVVAAVRAGFMIGQVGHDE